MLYKVHGQMRMLLLHYVVKRISTPEQTNEIAENISFVRLMSIL